MVEIKSTISTQELNKYKGKALKQLEKGISIDGFRKDHIPESVFN